MLQHIAYILSTHCVRVCACTHVCICVHLPAPGYCAHSASARSQTLLGDAVGAGVVGAGDDVAEGRVHLRREARS